VSASGGERPARGHEVVAELVRCTRAAQGLPQRIVDETVIDLIASALATPDESADAGGKSAA